MESTTQIRPAPEGKGFFTPLRTYVLALAVLVLLVSAPFTVGRGVAYLGVVLSGVAHAMVQWAAHAPLLSWFIAAGLGVVFVSGILAIGFNSDWIDKSRARGVLVATALVLVLLGLEAVYLSLPGIDVLYAAFGAAGGTPAWLNVISSGLVILFANAGHVALGIAVMAVLSCSMDSLMY